MNIALFQIRQNTKFVISNTFICMKHINVQMLLSYYGIHPSFSFFLFYVDIFKLFEPVNFTYRTFTRRQCDVQ